MSIYASGADIGEDADGATNGDVLAYQRSHVFPMEKNPRAVISLASIPAWCIPGLPGDDDSEAVARYLRFDVLEKGEMVTSTVVLTEVGVTKLRNELTEWLARPKADPA